MPGIVFQADRDTGWSMHYLSAGCATLTGYRPDQLVERYGSASYNAITHPEDLPRVLQTIDQGIQQNQTYGVEYRTLPRWSNNCWARMRFWPF